LGLRGAGQCRAAESSLGQGLGLSKTFRLYLSSVSFLIEERPGLRDRRGVRIARFRAAGYSGPTQNSATTSEDMKQGHFAGQSGGLNDPNWVYHGLLIGPPSGMPRGLSPPSVFRKLSPRAARFSDAGRWHGRSAASIGRGRPWTRIGYGSRSHDGR